MIRTTSTVTVSAKSAREAIDVALIEAGLVEATIDDVTVERGYGGEWAVELTHRPLHTVRGEPIGPDGVPYGTTHDYDCPGCAGTAYTASPRSETYWAS